MRGFSLNVNHTCRKVLKRKFECSILENWMHFVERLLQKAIEERYRWDELTSGSLYPKNMANRTRLLPWKLRDATNLNSFRLFFYAPWKLCGHPPRQVRNSSPESCIVPSPLLTKNSVKSLKGNSTNWSVMSWKIMQIFILYQEIFKKFGHTLSLK